MNQSQATRTDTSTASATAGNGALRGETILGYPVTGDRWNTVVEITPAKAGMILKAMPRQRPLNKSRIAWFKSLIACGQFLTTHQGMVFNTKGELDDGQHRLTACVESDTNITVRVFFNEPPHNFVGYDRGWSRSIAHDLVVQGVANGRAATILQAAGRLLYHYDGGRLPWSNDNASAGRIYTADVLSEVMHRHPLLLETIEFIQGRTARPPRPPEAPLAAFGTLFREVDDALACAFIDAVLTGEGLREGDPALVLRTTLGQSGSRHSTQIRNAFMVRLVHAWANVRSGKRVRSLMSAMPSGDFPKISGYKV